MSDPLRDALDDFYKQVLLAPRRTTGRAARGGCDLWRKFRSRGLGVHPKQVEQANARAKRHGIKAEYSPRGHCYVASRRERAKLLRLEALHDNEGGYGDG